MAAGSAGVAVGRDDAGAGDGAGAMNQALVRWLGVGCVAAAVVVPDMAEGGDAAAAARETKPMR